MSFLTDRERKEETLLLISTFVIVLLTDASFLFYVGAILVFFIPVVHRKGQLTKKEWMSNFVYVSALLFAMFIVNVLIDKIFG
ncbi:hypothetical protein [Salimicrobium halophilum]|uniref:Uncharacterized protein n=1 Tax=Salimicrobium halophilum TaxID=86666 RepID=A0A1G8RBL1_9BACI|nr:hypothetical protein [Salimicrobium halophilum]SDJ14356.1 hypothetical protein SAMN04490247_0939 [Salimicrobium halophilum]